MLYNCVFSRIFYKSVNKLFSDRLFQNEIHNYELEFHINSELNGNETQDLPAVFNIFLVLIKIKFSQFYTVASSSS